jgi:parallel beta-helix repeat protein
MNRIKEFFRDKKKLILFIFVILLILVSSGIFLIFHKEKPLVYDFYVASGKSSGDGTESKPFKTIAEAVEASSEKDSSHRKIFVFNGKYKESVVLPEDTQLYGQGKDNTIIKGADPYPKGTSVYTPGIQIESAVTMKNNSSLNNVTVSGGNPGITAEGNASIENCLVTDTGIQGINALAGNFSITIKDSEIAENNGKGIYMQKDRHFFINNIKSHHNTGEGIDLRESVSGIISKNMLYSNEQSGIELIVGSSNIVISDNKIIGNGQDGIQTQYCSGPSCTDPESLKTGNIKLINNDILYNKDNGLKCTNPTGNPPKEYYSGDSWKKSISMENNSFSGNKKVFDSRCKLKESDNKMRNTILRFISKLIGQE